MKYEIQRLILIILNKTNILFFKNLDVSKLIVLKYFY